jgi:hypothetical protein
MNDICTRFLIILPGKDSLGMIEECCLCMGIYVSSKIVDTNS